jgi:hypothetical protein
MSKTESEREKTARLPSALCWVALSLFAASLVLPALRVQDQGEWIAGDPGFHCAFLSLAEFPCWVPHALVIAAPLIAMFAGKPAQKMSGAVLRWIALLNEFRRSGLTQAEFRPGDEGQGLPPRTDLTLPGGQQPLEPGRVLAAAVE